MDKEPEPILKQRTRLIIAFLILCAASVLILFTGPEFDFIWQVILSSVLFFFLFWLIT
tara:strand:+ start:344 stop:517 length:174 start_codon:yes stop_codon:yes gene_type:complete